MANDSKNRNKNKGNGGTGRRDKEFIPKSDRGSSGNSDRSGDASRKSVFNRVVDHNTNDWSWYARDEKQARDVASLPLGIAAGTALQSVPTSSFPRGLRVPGIMILPYHFRFGDDTNGVISAANASAQALYSITHHENSGTRTYEPVDQWMAMQAFKQLHVLLAEAHRAYGVSQYYARDNRYTGKALLTALGWDAEDILNNPAQFRTAINKIAQRMSVFLLPDGFSDLERHLWLSSKVWKDDEGQKAQFYAYRLNYFIQWDATTRETGSALRYWPMSLFEDPDIGRYTIASFTAQFNKMLDALWQDTDISNMLKDLVHSFKPEQFTTLTWLGEDYITVPEFDMLVRDQLCNLTTVGDIAGTYDAADSSSVGSTNPWVYQRDGLVHSELLYVPYRGDGYQQITFSTNSNRTGRIINFATDGASPMDILVATRLVVCKGELLNYQYRRYTGVGSECVSRIELFTLMPDPEGGQYLERIDTGTELYYTDGYDNSFIARILCVMDKFDYHPRQYVYNTSAPESDTTEPLVGDLIHISGDLACYAELPMETQRLMSEIAVLNELLPSNLGNYDPLR